MFTFVKTVKTYKKTTVFLSGLTVYGAIYSKNLYRDAVLRVKYCNAAKEYGNKSIYQGQRPRRVTVFLNPAAQKGKARKLFEKNVAPLLFLAGLEVTTIKTEHEGQAKQFMEVLEDTDAIVIAGGNGLVGEVITGLLKRPDQERFSRIPIGIVPVGHKNTLANTLCKKRESAVEWMAELGMSIVKGTTQNIDVMHLLSDDGKSVYAVDSLTWSTYEDAEERKSKYWFVGPLKHRFTYLMSTIGYWPSNKTGEISFGAKCSGCSRCYVPPNNRRWWHAIVPSPRTVVPEYARRDNPECGVRHAQKMNTIELRAKTCNDSKEAQDKPCMQIYIGQESISRSNFIKEGWSRIRNPKNTSSDQYIEASVFKLFPETETDKAVMYGIDYEEFDAVPVEVTLLENKLTVFCP